jgi:hypothetical protein
MAAFAIWHAECHGSRDKVGHTARMSQSITDQMLGKGIVRENETPEAQRAALRDARPVEPEKALPPAFEAPARGVIIESSSMERPATRLCIDCGMNLAMAPRGKVRCAECTADA